MSDYGVKGIYSPRLPSYRRKIATEKREIRALTFKDLPDQNRSHYGVDGSPTRVERIFPPRTNDNRVLYEGETGEMAEKLFEILSAGKFIEAR